MKKMRRSLLSVFCTLCLMLVAGLVLVGSAAPAEAATEYKALFASGKTTVKSGKYYFRYTTSSPVTVYMSKKKSSGYVKTPMVYDSYTNGTQAYYIRDNVLYKFVYSTRKETKLKTLKVSGDEYMNISTIYGKQIFITKSSFDQWKLWTYSYNTGTKKLKKVKTNCSISDRYGKYVTAMSEFRSDVSPNTITLYKVTSTGLSKIKKLTSNGHNGIFVNGKIYYNAYPQGTMKKTTLYRCNANGSGKKALGTFKSTSEYGEVMVMDITSKKCKVYISGEMYEYTYSTKKMKKIS